HVFTSPHDAVLKGAVPLWGSADRRYCGTRLAGLIGFERPKAADSETGRQYRKIETIPWRPEFAEWGNNGGHTDPVEPAFVRVVIAPMLVAQVTDELALGPPSADEPGKISSPEAARTRTESKSSRPSVPKVRPN